MSKLTPYINFLPLNWLGAKPELFTTIVLNAKIRHELEEGGNQADVLIILLKHRLLLIFWLASTNLSWPNEISNEHFKKCFWKNR